MPGAQTMRSDKRKADHRRNVEKLKTVHQSMHRQGKREMARAW
jgi:hypothetical protein